MDDELERFWKVVAQSRRWPPSVLERLTKPTKSSVRTYGGPNVVEFTATNKKIVVA